MLFSVFFVGVSWLKLCGSSTVGFKRVACAAISPHSCMLSCIQVHCYLPLGQLHADFRDLNNGVHPVMKITVAESNPDMGLFNTDILLLPRRSGYSQEDFSNDNVSGL